METRPQLEQKTCCTILDDLTDKGLIVHSLRYTVCLRVASAAILYCYEAQCNSYPNRLQDY